MQKCGKGIDTDRHGPSPSSPKPSNPSERKEGKKVISRSEHVSRSRTLHHRLHVFLNSPFLLTCQFETWHRIPKIPLLFSVSRGVFVSKPDHSPHLCQYGATRVAFVVLEPKPAKCGTRFVMTNLWGHMRSSFPCLFGPFVYSRYNNFFFFFFYIMSSYPYSLPSCMPKIVHVKALVPVQ